MRGQGRRAPHHQGTKGVWELKGRPNDDITSRMCAVMGLLACWLVRSYKMSFNDWALRAFYCCQVVGKMGSIINNLQFRCSLPFRLPWTVTLSGDGCGGLSAMRGKNSSQEGTGSFRDIGSDRECSLLEGETEWQQSMSTWVFLQLNYVPRKRMWLKTRL